MDLLNTRNMILAFIGGAAGMAVGSHLAPDLQLVTGLSGVIALGYGFIMCGWSALMLADITDYEAPYPGGAGFWPRVWMAPAAGAFIGLVVVAFLWNNTDRSHELVTQKLTLGVVFGAMFGAALFWTILWRHALRIRQDYV